MRSGSAPQTPDATGNDGTTPSISTVAVISCSRIGMTANPPSFSIVGWFGPAGVADSPLSGRCWTRRSAAADPPDHQHHHDGSHHGPHDGRFFTNASTRALASSASRCGFARTANWSTVDAS